MLSIVIGGTEYSLDDGTYGVLTGYDGWGMAPMRRLSQRGAQQNGDTDLGYRLDPRFGTLTFKLEATTLEAMYAFREDLLQLFAPQNNPTLRWAHAYGTRDIDVDFAGELTMPWDVQQWAAQTVQVRLKASDPTFYDPTAVAVTFSLAGAGDTLEVPLEVPMVVGTSSLNATANIDYAGTFRSHPHLVRITGPITDCVITNTTTDEKLDFTGVTIAVGDYYDIDTRYGEKSVEDASGTNKIADLTADSDLATFHLEAPVGLAASKTNQFTVTGSSVTAATKVEILYYTRYLGQ